MRGIKTTTISILAVGLLAGSAVGVAAQDEPSVEATEVTGQVIQGERIAVPQPVERPDGILVGEGFVSLQTWDTSDPRLNGDATYTVNTRSVPDCCGIVSEAYELTNDGGSWLGDGRGYGIGTDRNGFVVLTGRDGYEGLTAFVDLALGEGNAWDLKGIIFPSEVPPVPEPYTGE